MRERGRFIVVVVATAAGNVVGAASLVLIFRSGAG
jgi:hypothetical protein